MASLNKAQLIGRLTADPTLASVPSTGASCCRFTLVVNRRYKLQTGAYKEEATFFRVSVFGNMAVPCSQYLNKGSLVYVEGSISLDTWTSRSGEKVSDIAIRAERVIFLESRRSPSGLTDPGEPRAPVTAAGFRSSVANQPPPPPQPMMPQPPPISDNDITSGDIIDDTPF